MRWNSKWSEGYPGWHIECTAMGTKYLGEQFDIHGGGLDLQFPHHECEIAQSVAANGIEAVKYWMHNNLITINGQKMSKSLNNFITLLDLFSGENDLLEKAYTPMTIRFFILQSNYRSPLDFSNEALQASEKGFSRLMKAIDTLAKINTSESSSIDVNSIEEKCYAAINDDFNTPVLIAHLFDGVKIINSIAYGKEKISADDLKKLKKLYNDFTFDILGFNTEIETNKDAAELENKLIELLLNTRLEAKMNKNYALADKIRNQLTEMGIIVKDKKDSFEWAKK